MRKEVSASRAAGVNRGRPDQRPRRLISQAPSDDLVYRYEPHLPRDLHFHQWDGHAAGAADSFHQSAEDREDPVSPLHHPVPARRIWRFARPDRPTALEPLQPDLSSHGRAMSDSCSRVTGHRREEYRRWQEPIHRHVLGRHLHHSCQQPAVDHADPRGGEADYLRLHRHSHAFGVHAGGGEK
jgi:hypothetical protein